MAIDVEHRDGALHFSVPVDLMGQLEAWNHEQDRLVFREQRQTGSYHGQFEVNQDVTLLQAYAEREGRIMPYYGATAASVEIYTFFWSEDGWALQIDHSVTHASRIWLPSEIGTAEQAQHAPRRTFVIGDQMYLTLTRYKANRSWSDLFQHCRFHFSGTTLGAVVWLTDMQTGQRIDLTDYSDW